MSSVLPVINSPDSKIVKEQIKKAAEFSDSFHLDVTDGKFTSYVNWADPEIFKGLNFEVHLMVEAPEKVVEEWLKTGAKRVIVHLQTITDFDFIIEVTEKYGSELMISIDPSVPVEEALVYLDKISSFHVLAVHPGPSGQEFQKEALTKIKFLREHSPNVKIEVDGGIDAETGKLAKEAGADILAAGDYIFGSDNPKHAYEELKKL